MQVWIVVNENIFTQRRSRYMNTSNITKYKPKDIVSILHVFSCRLYGLRKYKKQIQEDKEIEKEILDRNNPDARTAE